MHEILYRGKRKDNGEWVEGHLIWYKNDKALIMPLHTPISGLQICDTGIICCTHIIFEVIPETVGQYTGLNDNTKWEQLTKEEQSNWLKNHTVEEWNGKKIFEGDILTDNPDNKIGNIFEVVWYEELAGFMLDDGLELSITSDWLECHGNNKILLEIIGNTTDNPELLKGGVEK